MTSATVDPQATRIVSPIPPERRMVAVKGYHDRAGRMFDVGDIFDANDDFVRHNPQLFEKVQR
jgi:hypothetical protein